MLIIFIRIIRKMSTQNQERVREISAHAVFLTNRMQPSAQLPCEAAETRNMGAKIWLEIAQFSWIVLISNAWFIIF